VTLHKQTLLLATRNAGKVREFKQLLEGVHDLAVYALDQHPELPDVVEDGVTFEDNARKKAVEIARATRCMVLADDSGLEVDALQGRPGVFSARYAGTHGDDEANNDKLLQALADVPDSERSARYRVVLALADPRGALGENVRFEVGVCEGTILRERRGEGGFGYDSLFQPVGHTQTMAELSPDAKNRISHRALATRKIQQFLVTYLAN
jgi:XTP/dITP diphosphohydrolase